MRWKGSATGTPCSVLTACCSPTPLAEINHMITIKVVVRQGKINIPLAMLHLPLAWSQALQSCEDSDAFFSWCSPASPRTTSIRTWKFLASKSHIIIVRNRGTWSFSRIIFQIWRNHHWRRLKHNIIWIEHISLLMHFALSPGTLFLTLKNKNNRPGNKAKH